LVELDQLELPVVEDDPDHRDVVLHRRHQLEAGHVVATVAAAHDDRTVRLGVLDSERPVRVARHGCERPGLAEVLAISELQVVAQPHHVSPGVAENDGVVRESP
jgi:hypothetical protein